MYRGMFMIRKSGLIVPEPFLEKVKAEFPGPFGVAIVQESGPILRETMDPRQGDASLDEVLTAFKDNVIGVYFGDHKETETHENSIQPFELLRDSGNNTVVVAFADGDFVANTVDSSGSAAYAMVDSFLKKLVLREFNSIKGDVDQLFLNILDDQHILKDAILNTIKTKGDIALLGSNKEYVHLGRGDRESQQFDWGFVSNTLGYIEGSFPEKAEPEVPAEPPKTGLARLQAKLGKVNPSAIKPSSQKEDEKKVAAAIAAREQKTVVHRTDTAPSVTGVSEDDSYIKLPSPNKEELKNQGVLKQFLIEACGFTPTNWKERPNFTISKSRYAEFRKKWAKLNAQGYWTRVEKNMVHSFAELSQDNKTAEPPSEGTTIETGPIEDEDKLVNEFTKTPDTVEGVKDTSSHHIQPEPKPEPTAAQGRLSKLAAKLAGGGTSSASATRSTPDASAEQSGPSKRPPVPVLSPDERAAVLAFIKKPSDHKLLGPDAMEEMEKRLPTLAHQIGWDEQNLNRLPYEVLPNFIRQFPDATAAWINSLRLKALRYDKMVVTQSEEAEKKRLKAM